MPGNVYVAGRDRVVVGMGILSLPPREYLWW